MRLSGKRALVTGGGTGIGQAIAYALAREGCRVAIAGRRAEKVAQAAKAYTGTPPLLHRACDVGDRASVEALFDWLNGSLGDLDILVNSAGVNIARRGMEELSPADWDYLLQVNATGAYDCIRLALPAMRQRGDGLIVNINSISGKRASVLGGVAYSAAKFAMTALGATVALEEGPKGIRVTNVFPGEVDTPLLEQRPVPVTAEHRARILLPDDVAAAVLMVACLPPRAHIPELIVKPTIQGYA